MKCDNIKDRKRMEKKSVSICHLLRPDPSRQKTPDRLYCCQI